MPDFNPADIYYNADPRTISELFSNNPHLRIPPYQRFYAWKAENFQVLWEDIVRTIESNFHNYELVAETEQKPHFLGALVTDKYRDMSVTYEDIIDGQQRTVTISILLAVLRDYVKNMTSVDDRENLERNLTNLLISGPAQAGMTNFKSRIELNSDKYQDFYMKCVINPRSLESRQEALGNLIQDDLDNVEERIVEALNTFIQKVGEHVGPSTEKEYDAKMKRLVNTVCLLLSVLHVSVRRRGLAYKIFETLNTRGVNLTQADLIKNEVFTRAEKSGQADKSMKRWAEMHDDLPDEAETEYIRFHHISTTSLVKESGLFSEIATYLKDKNALDYVSELQKEAPI